MSSIKNCTNCGANISEAVQYCPKCGAKQNVPFSADELLKNPYDILQISLNAEQEVVEAAYKSLARKYHPDTVGSKESDERMKDINWAYAVLSNPEKKKEWDQKNKQREEIKTKQEPVFSHSYKAAHSDRAAPHTPDTSQTTTRQKSSSDVARPKTENRSALWIILALVVIMAFVYLSNSASNNLSTNQTSSSMGKSSTPTRPRPTSTRPRPTPTRPRPTPTRSKPVFVPQCNHWSEVTLQNVGEYMCVHGYVKRWYSTDDFATVIRFSENASDFILYDPVYTYTDLKSGDCIEADGRIERMGQKPSLNLNGVLYNSDYCSP